MILQDDGIIADKDQSAIGSAAGGDYLDSAIEEVV
jgi:hypothetical protein